MQRMMHMILMFPLAKAADFVSNQLSKVGGSGLQTLYELTCLNSTLESSYVNSLAKTLDYIHSTNITSSDFCKDVLCALFQIGSYGDAPLGSACHVNSYFMINNKSLYYDTIIPLFHYKNNTEFARIFFAERKEISAVLNMIVNSTSILGAEAGVIIFAIIFPTLAVLGTAATMTACHISMYGCCCQCEPEREELHRVQAPAHGFKDVYKELSDQLTTSAMEDMKEIEKIAQSEGIALPRDVLIHILHQSPGRTDTKYREAYIRANKTLANLAPADFDVPENTKRPIVRFFDTRARKNQIAAGIQETWMEIQRKRRHNALLDIEPEENGRQCVMM